MNHGAPTATPPQPQPSEPKDGERTNEAAKPPDTRKPYERPELIHLGSVNRLTLGASSGNVSDTGGKLKTNP